MKKIFFFASAMLVAASMSAETIYDWASNVGTTTIAGDESKMKTGQVNVNGVKVDCLELGSSFFVKDTEQKNVATNYVEISLASGNFQDGDVLNVTFCVNNSDASKTGVLGVFDAADNELTSESANNTYSASVDPSNLQYAIKSELASIRFGRKNGNTKVCITKLEVIRGGTITPKAAKPVFSVAGGDHFDPFKVAVESSNADKIFVSMNNGVFEEYTDSILIDQYDVDYTLSAYATLGGAENSDTATVTYKLIHFVPRPKFNARRVLMLDSVKESDIKILSGDNATIGSYSMDGVACPSVNYLRKPTLEGQDSVMLISLAGREELTFRYKNQNNKSNIMKFANAFTQCDGSNFEMWVDGVKSGDTIVFVVTAKGSAPKFNHTYSTASYLEAYQPDDDEDPCFTDGDVYTKSGARVDEDYIGWTNLVYIVEEGGHSRIRLKETANGFRIAKVLIGAYRGEAPAEGIEETVFAPKAVKHVIDGQLIIEKGGRKFNVLGAEIK